MFVILDILSILIRELALVNYSPIKYCNRFYYYIHHLADPCSYQLVAPQDGSISCTGVSTDDNCTFECNAGFSLFGEYLITCLPNHRWSADQPECTRLTCDGPPEPPEYGHVVLPCSDAFGQTCHIDCNTGYQLERGTTNRSCVADPIDRMMVYWTTDVTAFCGGNQSLCNIS